jgi:hypothetical protein
VLAILLEDQASSEITRCASRLLELTGPPLAAPQRGGSLQDLKPAAAKLFREKFRERGAEGSGRRVTLDRLAFRALHGAWKGVNFGSFGFWRASTRMLDRGVGSLVAGVVVRAMVCAEVSKEESQGPHGAALRSFQHALMAEVKAGVVEVFGDMIEDPDAFFRKGPKREVLGLVQATLQDALGDR